MTEPLVMVLMIAGPTLWMLGGYKWKGWRRIVWPILLAVVLVGGGGPLSLWKVVLATSIVAVTVALPYGDRTPNWLRPVVFGSYALPAVALNFSMWPSVPVVGLLLWGLYWATRRWNQVTWKLWEATAGLCQAGTLAVAVLWR